MLLEWEINGQARQHRLRPDGRTVLGRNSACDVVIEHPTVSRQHAEIQPHQGTFYVRNLSRTNVIFLEGYNGVTRLGWGEGAALSFGARLQLGSVDILLKPTLPTLKLRCSGPCGKVVEVPRSGFCPNCGTALSTADTFAG